MQKSLIDQPQEDSVPVAERTGRYTTANATIDPQQNSTLLAFPGVSRAVPQWRKQLSQRVRELQEQRAREAEEAEAVTRASQSVSCALPSGQLELVPDPEQAPMNPIVSKALERVDRARRSERQAYEPSVTAAAAAPALIPEQEEVSKPEPILEPSDPKPKLTIVTPATTKEETSSKTKRVGVISGQVEESALSYLESCLYLPALACDTRYDVAGLGRRTVGGVLDLLLVGLMVSPAALAIHLAEANWLDPRVFGSMSGITVIAMFAYLTLTIALTGRTLAMRWLSVRTIDLQTGLIPTGGQALKRSFAYVFSLALLGLGLAYAFIDPDHRTVHDRFSHTTVIRD